MIKWFLGLSLHMKVAIILAPFLAIFGYGLADLWVRPDTIKTAKQQTVVREMVLSEQCLLTQGQCTLTKDEMELSLANSKASSDELIRLDIRANQHIRGLKLALMQNGEEEELVAQQTMVTDHWFVEFPKALLAKPQFTLRLALAQTKHVYLAEFTARLQ